MRKSLHGSNFVLLGLTLLLVSCLGTAHRTPEPKRVASIQPTQAPTAKTGNNVSPQATSSAQNTPVPTENTHSTQVSPGMTVTSSGLPNFGHIIIIVMENKEASQIVGNPDAPFLNELARDYAQAADYYAISHPSLPNYLALTGGDTFGITSDCHTCFVNADNIANQLAAAGKTWKAYMESMPGPCFVGDKLPDYSVNHDPFMYYDDIRTNPDLCNEVVPFSQFSIDLRADTLPDFVWITPNTCNDMHSCAISIGDSWLKTLVPEILASPAWKDNGVLFITFDEGVTQSGCCSFAAGGKVFTLVISPFGKAGYVSTASYDHYSLLRTIEASWNLPLLEKAGSKSTPLMSEFFAR
jgi:hypothetical protein